VFDATNQRTEWRKIMNQHLGGKRILITGGTGSWGQEFTRQLLKGGDVRELRIYSRGEYQQVEMRRAFQTEPRLRFLIGDVRDKDRVSYAARGMDWIIHLAALKHVPVVEEHLWEALQTNTIGTQHVLDAAQAHGVEGVLFVSSDKAVDPMNFYGITKLAAERLVIAAGQDGGRTRFVVYRAGNVMGSAGSVIPVFQRQLLQQNMLTVTDPKMTRFFTSKRAVVRLAIQSFNRAVGGETFIPKMKATTLDLLARVMTNALGNEQTRIERIDVRPGEKHAELLVSRNESGRTYELSDTWVVLPFFPSAALRQQYEQAPSAPFKEYGSEDAPHFDYEELEGLLREEGFLSRDVAPPSGPLHFWKDGVAFH
jgi:FlaA1/EpsC-like NDP-sugar epimerase